MMAGVTAQAGYKEEIMPKQTKRMNNSVFITIIALLVVFCASLGVCNAWFTDSSQNKYVQVDVYINSLTLNVYQNSVLIDGKDTFIAISGAIQPDVAKDLNLSLRNDDETAGSYVKFKVEYFLANAGQDIDISSSVTTNVTAPTASTNGFVYDGSEYFVLKNYAQNAVVLSAHETVNLIDSFVIPYSVFYNGGNLRSGDILKIKLTVVAFD